MTNPSSQIEIANILSFQTGDSSGELCVISEVGWRHCIGSLQPMPRTVRNLDYPSHRLWEAVALHAFSYYKINS